MSAHDDLTEGERLRVGKAKLDQTATRLGCLALLLAVAFAWFATAHLFEWAMGWRDSWW
jgi:hypothetical protein